MPHEPRVFLSFPASDPVTSWDLFKHLCEHERSLSAWHDLALRHFSPVCGTRYLEGSPPSFPLGFNWTLAANPHRLYGGAFSLSDAGIEPFSEFEPDAALEQLPESPERIAALFHELQLATSEAREAAAAAREAVAELHAAESRPETLGHLAGRFVGDPFWSQLDDVSRDYWQDEDAG